MRWIALVVVAGCGAQPNQPILANAPRPDPAGVAGVAAAAAAAITLADPDAASRKPEKKQDVEKRPVKVKEHVSSDVLDRLDAQGSGAGAGSEGSSGDITARRWTHDGWIEGTTPIAISNGDLVASLDGAGKLSVTSFEVSIAPIDLPEATFGKPAQLTDVRVKLAKPVTADITWSGDDDATATVTLDLDLDWAIAIDGNNTPLGTQHLPPVQIDVALTGGGDHVDASFGLHAAGELWSWAGVIQLTALEMSLAGGTLD